MAKRPRSKTETVEMENAFRKALLRWMDAWKPTELEMLVLFNEQLSIGIKHLTKGN